MMDRPPTRSKQFVIINKVYINKTGWTKKYQQARNATDKTHAWYKYNSLDLRICCQRQSSMAAATLDPSAYGFANDTTQTRTQSLFMSYSWLSIGLRDRVGLKKYGTRLEKWTPWYFVLRYAKNFRRSIETGRLYNNASRTPNVIFVK